jgi:flagellar motor switch protein FliG
MTGLGANPALAGGAQGSLPYNEENGNYSDRYPSSRDLVIRKRFAPEEQTETTIKIAAQQLGGLYQLIGRESADRIAMVISRLEPQLRTDFLGFFEGERLAQILQSLSQPQFVDPEMLAQLKQKLERKLSGFFGGEEDVLKLLGIANTETRNSLLKTIEDKTPDLYQKIRPKILLFEDLTYFADVDFIKILSRIPLEKISWIISNHDDALKEKIFRCLPKKTVETLNQLVGWSGALPKQRVRQAKEELLVMADRMMNEGIISHPRVKELEEEALRTQTNLSQGNQPQESIIDSATGAAEDIAANNPPPTPPDEDDKKTKGLPSSRKS